jgi:hypothetical protein
MASTPSSSNRGSVRVPALLLGLVLVVLSAFWMVQAEKVGYGPYFSTISLFANCFFVLTGLLIINVVLRRFFPRGAFTQAELLTIYSMNVVGSALAGHDCVPVIVQMIAHPYYFADASNNWIDRFGRFLPEPLMVTDKAVLTPFYTGHSSLYTPEHLLPWLKPAGLWTLFAVLLFGVMHCLNVLMRQGWQERERLPFPVIEIPLQMTDPDATLWKSRVFWIGFVLISGIEFVNGLASFYPQIPKIAIGHTDITGQGIFGTRPWNAAGFTCYSFYPFAVGLGYLLPLDLLFSCWFFYLAWKAQMILSAQMAWDTTPEFPFVVEQSFGGYFAILAFMAWNGRHYLKAVWDKIWNEPSDVSDTAEALTYRQAALGALLGFLALVGFMWWAGMSPWLAAAAFAIYFCLSLAITRIRAELGPPVHDQHFSGPDSILPKIFGTPAFTGRDLTMLNFFWWFNRAYRSHPQPGAIEALKAAKDTGASQRLTFWAIYLAAFVGIVAAFWAYLHLAYTYGAQAKFNQGSGMAREAFNRLNGWIQTPTPPAPMRGGAVGVGFVFCSLLMIARTRFPWWPLHPIGYAISGSWSMNLVWMPLMIAWMIKGLALRYGGVRFYRQAMPFFLGITLGQMLTGSAWHLFGWAMGIVPYSFWGG